MERFFSILYSLLPCRYLVDVIFGGYHQTYLINTHLHRITHPSGISHRMLLIPFREYDWENLLSYACLFLGF